MNVDRIRLVLRLDAVVSVVSGLAFIGLAGVVSDGDLRRLLEKDPGLLSRTAGECLHANPKTVDPEEFASTALDRMESAKITTLFALDGDRKLTGAIHLHDLLSAGIS